MTDQRASQRCIGTNFSDQSRVCGCQGILLQNLERVQSENPFLVDQDVPGVIDRLRLAVARDVVPIHLPTVVLRLHDRSVS